MQRFIAQFCLVAGVLVLAACEGNQSSLDTFSSEVGQFSIAAPTDFEEIQQSVETPVGPVDIYTYTAETDEFAYVVAFSDYPAAIIEQAEPENLLNSSRDGAVNNLGGTLVSEEEIEIDGNPGRSLVINADSPTEGNATIESRIYLVDNRLYQILVVSREGKALPETATTFLESFDLKE